MPEGMALSGALNYRRHKVLEADDMRKAISLCRDNPDIELVIADFGMKEGPNGLDILGEIRKVTAAARLCLAGNELAPQLQAAANEIGAIVMKKPLLLDKLFTIFGA